MTFDGAAQSNVPGCAVSLKVATSIVSATFNSSAVVHVSPHCTSYLLYLSRPDFFEDPNI